MYNIKQIPEDFFVKEILKLNKKKNGEYSYFLLKKKDWNTIDIVNEISKRLKIKEKWIKYAGLKDRKAVTEQYISVKNVKDIKFKIKDASIEKVGEGDEPIKIGSLEGNSFIIVVRNLNDKKELKIDRVENYFDKQRFSNKNIKIGRALLKRDYKILFGALEIKNKEELFKFDMRILKFILNSYQSYIFNKALRKIIDKKIKVKKLPLINFDTEFENKEVEKIYMDILHKEGIKKEDFIFREMPFIVSESKDREIYAKVNNFRHKYEKDELNVGRYKCILKFNLNKGSYGTLVVKKLFG